ncbi:hypothetical protein ACFL2Q_10305 [Thermodesulfobacteriota bacterium]
MPKCKRNAPSAVRNWTEAVDHFTQRVRVAVTGSICVLNKGNMLHVKLSMINPAGAVTSERALSLVQTAS